VLALAPSGRASENTRMTILYYVVLFFHVLACLFLVAVVLLQQGKGQDLASAFGGGGTQTAFGPRGSANILSRTTTVLAGVFMITSLALTMLRPSQSSVLEALPAASPSPAASAAPSLPPLASPSAAPEAPASAAPTPLASPSAN
jgi:preprotein translocase subunit SecG